MDCRRLHSVFHECVKGFCLILRLEILRTENEISVLEICNINTIECNTNSQDAIYSWFHAVRADIERKPVKYSLARPADK